MKKKRTRFTTAPATSRDYGDAGKKSKKGYSINFSPFSRAMTSPLSTENPTPGGLIDEYLSTLYPLIMM
jgi:hypothetical protein